MRKLKFHESRLLRKNKFLIPTYNNDYKLISIFQIKKEEFYKIKKIHSIIKQIALSLVINKNSSNENLIKKFLNILYFYGFISEKKLILAYNLKLNNLLERKLSFLLKVQNLANSIVEAKKIIFAGHIKLGNKRINNDILISKNMENFISWDDNSKIKRCIDRFNNELDDYI